MDAWKDFSPFASAPCAEGLVSAHVSEGRDQKNDHNTVGSALRQAMSAASGIHEQYVPPSEQHITTTLPVLVTGGELYGASLDPTGDVQIEDLPRFVKAPLPGGQSLADVHVMTFDYFSFRLEVSRRSPLLTLLMGLSRCMFRMGKIREMTITPLALLSVKR